LEWQYKKNKNLISGEFKSVLYLGNAGYHSVENLLSSCPLSKNVKIKIYRPVIFPVVLYGCETWFLTLREEHALRVFENRVLRKIFELQTDEIIWGWRKLYIEEFHSLHSSLNIIRMSKSRLVGLVGHIAFIRRGMRAGFWWES
jgi:hypothetical protein